ncbi:Uncharacterized protein TCM_006928 [Theobroma cacao]|uniref:Uncharacterized protein n=1 Tax=Theobroma cacao TaxID=3641 RepID=A0A061E730_THECC|nr:Uncharacterized protein TCM_006928 [Theobroma cacao]
MMEKVWLQNERKTDRDREDSPLSDGPPSWKLTSAKSEMGNSARYMAYSYFRNFGEPESFIVSFTVHLTKIEL